MRLGTAPNGQDGRVRKELEINSLIWGSSVKSLERKACASTFLAWIQFSELGRRGDLERDARRLGAAALWKGTRNRGPSSSHHGLIYSPQAGGNEPWETDTAPLTVSFGPHTGTVKQ